MQLCSELRRLTLWLATMGSITIGTEVLAQSTSPNRDATEATTQEPAPLLSGPTAGTKLPACSVYAPSGPFAGTEFDTAEQVGDAPTALLFVHELTRNVAPLITGLDQIASEFAWTGLQTHTIRIAADRNEAEAAVKRSSAAMRLQRAMLVSTDGVDGPGGYALHRQATLTLVLAKGGMVVQSIAFTDTGRSDLGRLRELVEKVTGPVPREAAALRQAMSERLSRDPERLRQLVIDLTLRFKQTQEAQQERDANNQAMRPGNRGNAREGQQRPPTGKPREGNPPNDAELMALLRRAIQKAADQAELDAVFAAVEKRVGEDVSLRTQAVNMFKLQTSLEYGNEDSQRRAKAYIQKHGSK